MIFWRPIIVSNSCGTLLSSTQCSALLGTIRQVLLLEYILADCMTQVPPISLPSLSALSNLVARSLTASSGQLAVNKELLNVLTDGILFEDVSYRNFTICYNNTISHLYCSSYLGFNCYFILVLSDQL